MIATLKLLLPALFPSWRFFDVIGPSPKIEYAYLKAEQQQAEQWHEYSRRPDRRTFIQILLCLFYNASWNQYLYITRCAERLLEEPNVHSETEIIRVLRETTPTPQVHEELLQFRILLTERQGSSLRSELAYVSVPYSLK